MIIKDMLESKKISKYRLSKISGVPQATVNDICSGKTCLEKCAAGTLYKIAKSLDVTIESLLEAEIALKNSNEQRMDFEIFKSNVCHYVKDLGDIDFMIRVLESDSIRNLYNKGWYPEAFYLLAMIDYLSRDHNIPLCTNYNDIRTQKLAAPIYPSSVLAISVICKTDQYKKDAVKAAIPEFIRFNIVESEVRNVC